MAGLRYYKGLDGFRALAVLMVVLIHSRWLPIGWVGVQMFFVLSGFLITGILVAQRALSFREFIGGFYWRRCLRIWPLYYFFIGACGVAYLVIQVPEMFKASWLPLVTYTYNFAAISPTFPVSDYFGHFWTLCVEEQFYLVWPLLVFLLPPKWFRGLVVGLIFAGPVIRFVTGEVFGTVLATEQLVQKAVHVMTTSHLDAFASGAFLALLSQQQRAQFAPRARMMLFVAVGVTAACGLGNSFALAARGLPPHWLALGYDDLSHFRQYVWSYSLLNITSAALIFCLMERKLLPGLFEHRVAVYLGSISYGIYVWHLPILHVLFTHWPAEPHSPEGILRFLVLVTATVGVATLTYFGFERTFLRMKGKPPGSGKPALAEAPVGSSEA